MNRKLFWLSGWIILIILSALSAGYAQQTQGISQTPGQIVKFDDGLNTVDSVITESNGNIGVGTPSPQATLEVSAPNGAISVGAALAGGQATGLQFLNWGAQHAGLRWSQGSNNLILEDASNNNDPTSWYSGNAVNFIVRNGRVGIGTTNPGAALHIVGANPTTGFALRIDQASPNGDGLLAYVNTTSSTRTVFSAGSNVVGLQVKGDGRVGIGTTTPVAKLQVVAEQGFAVAGQSTNTSGVDGFSTNGTGVFGTSTNFVGVQGRTGNVLQPGVLAVSAGGSVANLGLRVLGRARATGGFSTGSGAFETDNPLDPANKYLRHSFVGSPDMKNIYDGVVVLDAHGEALVDLPEWFEAINRDFRYQLTCIGSFAPVYVAEKISGNRFKISGGQPGLEVSWQVSGIRKDPYAEKYPIQVQEEKPASEKGLYLHPDAYGQPQTKSIQ